MRAAGAERGRSGPRCKTVYAVFDQKEMHRDGVDHSDQLYYRGPSKLSPCAGIYTAARTACAKAGSWAVKVK